MRNWAVMFADNPDIVCEKIKTFTEYKFIESVSAGKLLLLFTLFCTIEIYGKRKGID